MLVCVLDIFFNFFLINPTREMELFGQTVTMFSFGWGVPGAALGTALATMIGGLAALAVLLLRESPLAIRSPGSWKITRSCLINLWRVCRWRQSAPPSPRLRCFSSASCPSWALWPLRPTAWP